MSRFTSETFQNEYLPDGGSEVHAIVTVTCLEGDGPARRPQGAEIVIVDTSGSMDVPRTKIKAAREATAAAIDCIRDGVPFGVIAGMEFARTVYPEGFALVPASPGTRNEAKQAVARLKADGGTAMGSWLTCAGALFATVPEGAHHAILLTDGENEHESDEELAAALAGVEARFQCDCRGVGTDWRVSELRRVASTLLGSLDIIADPADMAADFRRMIEAAMSRATGDVTLGVWTPRGAQLAFVRQVAPTIEELTHRGTTIDALNARYPTGAWGEESRDYHLCVKVTPRETGDEMLAARISLLEGGEVRGQALVKAIWTDDEALSTRMDRAVAHYTGQAELAEAIQDGLEARKAGDRATATFKLGRAVQLAAEGGNEATMKLLAAVVHVEDPATGTVRLRAEVQEAEEMALDTRSTKTVRVVAASP